MNTVLLMLLLVSLLANIIFVTWLVVKYDDNEFEKYMHVVDILYLKDRIEEKEIEQGSKQRPM